MSLTVCLPESQDFKSSATGRHLQDVDPFDTPTEHSNRSRSFAQSAVCCAALNATNAFKIGKTRRMVSRMNKIATTRPHAMVAALGNSNTNGIPTVCEGARM